MSYWCFEPSTSRSSKRNGKRQPANCVSSMISETASGMKSPNSSSSPSRLTGMAINRKRKSKNVQFLNVNYVYYFFIMLAARRPPYYS